MAIAPKRNLVFVKKDITLDGNHMQAGSIHELDSKYTQDTETFSEVRLPMLQNVQSEAAAAVAKYKRTIEKTREDKRFDDAESMRAAALEDARKELDEKVQELRKKFDEESEIERLKLIKESTAAVNPSQEEREKVSELIGITQTALMFESDPQRVLVRLESQISALSEKEASFMMTQLASLATSVEDKSSLAGVYDALKRKNVTLEKLHESQDILHQYVKYNSSFVEYDQMLAVEKYRKGVRV
ncbi:hypothetical protein [Cytobacillus firmus]|uniref:hypothetical protein n=1 Tax=Cytobacillus firmus TaxID=1399 RepID=UPI001CFE5A42|nr:hypothetical protein [Cytobacillus firmus]